VSNTRQVNKYLTILNAIESKNKKNIDPSEILEQLLLEYIQSNQPKTIFRILAEPPSLLLMKECLGWLKPVKYAQYAILPPGQKNYSESLTTRDVNDDMLCFIGHLNLRIQKTQFPKDLYEILSVFFSFYIHYRDKMNITLLSNLTNIWHDRIDQAIDIAFKGILIPERQPQLEALERITSFKHWIPATNRVQISDLILRHLQKGWYVSETITMLIELKKWIVLDKRELILKELITRIVPGESISINSLNALNALKAVHEWRLPEDMLPRIHKQMFKLIERCIYLMKEGELEEKTNVMELFLHLIPLIPVELHKEVLTILLNNARSKNGTIKTYALEVLKFSADIISPDRYDEVIACIDQHIDVHVSDEKERICANACAAFGMLNHITANIKYLPIINKLLQIMDNDQNPENVRFASLLSIGKLINIIPADLLDESYFPSILKIFVNRNEDVGKRYLAVKTLASMHSCSKQTNLIILSMMSKIADKTEENDLRCQAIQQLSVINQWIYSENCKYVLPDLLKVASDKNENRELVAAIFKLITTVNITLSDEIVISLVKPYSDDLKALVPLKRKESIEMLGHLSGLIKNELCAKVINELSNMLNDANIEVRRTAYTTLDLYKSHMSCNQKIELLTLLYTKPIEESGVLLTNIYSEHTRDISLKMLQSVPTTIDQYRLTEDITKRVMSYV
jgi:hypothetical protein